MPITIDPTTDTTTMIANLRDDAIAAHEMIEIQRERIAALEAELEAQTGYTARASCDLFRAEKRGNTYRRRALVLHRKAQEERIWARYYHAEADRLQRENDAMHAELETIKDAASLKLSDSDLVAIVRSVLS